MRKYYVGLVVLFALLIYPATELQMDDNQVMLAKTLYAMGRARSEEMVLNIGTVVMNRIESERYPDDMREVLDDESQFSRCSAYDERSMALAKDLLRGKRTLGKDVVSFDVAALRGNEWRIPE